MAKVRFVFDARKELEYIRYFEKNFRRLDIPADLREVIDDNASAIKLIEGKYNDANKQTYELGWRKIEDAYFSLVEKITGHAWAHENYTVYLTEFMLGFCDPMRSQAQEVTARQQYSDIERNYIIAHELFHSHYFDIAEKIGNGDLFKTELNENADILALCFTELREVLFKKDDEWIIEYLIRSNAKAHPYFERLLAIWETRKSFDDYLAKSAEVVSMDARGELHALEQEGKYVFHGSAIDTGLLEPREAFDAERGSEGDPAVYASSSADYAIFMAIINKWNCPSGVHSTFGMHRDADGSYHPRFWATQDTLDQLKNPASGLVYVLDKGKFSERKGRPTEFLSREPVRPFRRIQVAKRDLPHPIFLITQQRELSSIPVLFR